MMLWLSAVSLVSCARVCYNSTGPACQLSRWCTPDRRLIRAGCSYDTKPTVKCVKNGAIVRNTTGMGVEDSCWATFRTSNAQYLFEVVCKGPLLVTCTKGCCMADDPGSDYRFATLCGDGCRVDCIKA